MEFAFFFIMIIAVIGYIGESINKHTAEVHFQWSSRKKNVRDQISDEIEEKNPSIYIFDLIKETDNSPKLKKWIEENPEPPRA